MEIVRMGNIQMGITRMGIIIESKSAYCASCILENIKPKREYAAIKVIYKGYGELTLAKLFSLIEILNQENFTNRF